VNWSVPRPTRDDLPAIVAGMPPDATPPEGVGRKMTLEASRFGPPSSDRELAALAAAQYGVVSREQIRALGLNDTAISQRCRAGRLHRVHFGVYAVGHSVLTQPGRWMAAVLACGPGGSVR
jgi:hypothetical protein